jgi:hypothetical protein
LKKNAKVYLTARTERKARTAIEELEAETGHKALFLELELSDLRSVRSAVAAFLRCVSCCCPIELEFERDFSRERELHILCLNACVACFHCVLRGDQLTIAFSGVMWCHKDLLTVQGYDMHIGTNVIVCSSLHLCYCLLTVAVSSTGPLAAHGAPPSRRPTCRTHLSRIPLPHRLDGLIRCVPRPNEHGRL